MPSSPKGQEAPVVLAQGLSKVYRDFWMRPRARAVEGLDLRIERGEIFGLLGPNGSGKSTTIKLILGLLKKTNGRLAVFGKPPSDVSTKKRIGLLPEESYLYPFLTAVETLEYYAKLFQIDRRVRRRRAEELLDMVGLNAVAHRQVREYSKGMQRRIGIAQALINDPEFLILDEPTTGLDPIGTRQVKDLVLELGRRGKTILLSSHQLADVEDTVDRMAILYGGKQRAEGTCEELLADEGRTIIEMDAIDDSTVSALDTFLHDRAGIAIRSVSRPRQRLEDLFVGIVERAREDRLATSGATHGGQTASFLRAEDAESTAESTDAGEALIDQLTAPELPVKSVASAHKEETSTAKQPKQLDASSETTADAADPASGLSERMIQGLVQAYDSDSKAQEMAKEASEPLLDPKDADEDMIRSLLGGNDTNKKDASS